MDFFSKATIQSKRTGLKVKIWVDDKGLTRKLTPNQYTFKFGYHENEYLIYNFKLKVLIGDPKKHEIKTEEINDVKEWAELNEEILTQLYDGTIDIIDFINKLKIKLISSKK